jgi:hypothetical protein
MATNSDHDDSEQTRAAFREFGLACRAERDRLALAGMAQSDRRFDTSIVERGIADAFVARLIASLVKR